MSRFYSRAAYFYNGRTPDSNAKPTTLSESGDRSPRGFGYANTGTRNPSSPIEQGGADTNKFFQPGAEDNTSQAAQARKGFMDSRSAQLVTEHERGQVQENRFNRGQAKMRLKGEVF